MVVAKITLIIIDVNAMKASLAKIVKQQTSALEKRATVMVYVTESLNLPIKTSLANVTLDGQAQSVSRSIIVTI